MGRRVFLFALVFALWTAAPAQAQPFSILLVQTTADETVVGVSSGGPAGTARVRIFVPSGFTLNLTRPVGAVVGRASLELSSAAAPGGEGSTTEGDVVVADPARYAGKSRVQACAPGPHAAAWRLEPLDVPVFVDTAAGPDTALGGYELTTCLDLPEGLSLGAFYLDLLRTIVPPAAPGIYLWRAFVTPVTSTGATDESGTWEVRGVVPWPAVLSLHARRVKGKGRYLLYGRLVLAGKPRAGAAIRILRFSASSGSGVFVLGNDRTGSVGTNRAGRFRVRVHLSRRTVFYAFWLPFPREGCSAPSTAPGGCLTETTSPAVSRRLVLRPG